MADNEKLGSTSPQVLLKNATNLDKLVNGRESESLPDRFAVLRRTWFGMEMIPIVRCIVRKIVLIHSLRALAMR
jgi:hypothetical protein